MQPISRWSRCPVRNWHPSWTSLIFISTIFKPVFSVHVENWFNPNELCVPLFFDWPIALFGVIFVRYGNWISLLEQVENTPKFSQPSEGQHLFTNGFRNLTNQLQFLNDSRRVSGVKFSSRIEWKWIRTMLTKALCVFHDVDRTCRAVVHSDCYVIIIVFLHTTPAYPSPGTVPVT